MRVPESAPQSDSQGAGAEWNAVVASGANGTAKSTKCPVLAFGIHR